MISIKTIEKDLLNTKSSHEID